MPYKDPEQKRLNGLAYREQNKEKLAAQRAAKYLANPLPAKERAKKRRELKPTECAAQTREWQLAHPERMQELRARYETPARHLARLHTRRYRLAGVFVEAVSREIVFERDHGICGICQEVVDPQNWHLDHKNPVSKGGEHSYANVQVSHPICNLKKHDKSTENKEAQRYENTLAFTDSYIRFHRHSPRPNGNNSSTVQRIFHRPPVHVRPTSPLPIS